MDKEAQGINLLDHIRL